MTGNKSFQTSADRRNWLIKNAGRYLRRDIKELKLEPGAAELNIFGLKGCSGKEGYIGFLERSLTEPHFLEAMIPAEELAIIAAHDNEEILSELLECRVRLAKLELDHAEVEAYISRLKAEQELAKREERPEDCGNIENELHRYMERLMVLEKTRDNAARE